jgi:chitinase
MSMNKILFMLLFCCSAAAAQPYKIIAYATGRAETIKQFPVEKLTHIIYSFLKISNDTLTFHNSEQERTVTELVALKQRYPALKIMVSVGGWGGCSFCSDLFAVDKHRKTFAKTTAELFRKYGIDGLDLDWEYPAVENYPGHKFTPADKDNFTMLVAELRKELGKELLLTFAAGGFVKYLEESIDWHKVMPLVDFVNLMTYDLVGGYATVTGHHTLLQDYRPGQESTAKAVNWLLGKKIPAQKLVIGAAMYARVWEEVPAKENGLYQSGKFKQGVAYADFNTYFSDTSGYKYYWDKKAKAPFQYNAAKKLFATFDDERSIAEKVKFIRRKKLGGIMFWELAQDKKANGLINIMYKGL